MSLLRPGDVVCQAECVSNRLEMLPDRVQVSKFHHPGFLFLRELTLGGHQGRPKPTTNNPRRSRKPTTCLSWSFVHDVFAFAVVLVRPNV